MSDASREITVTVNDDFRCDICSNIVEYPDMYRSCIMCQTCFCSGCIDSFPRCPGDGTLCTRCKNVNTVQPNMFVIEKILPKFSEHCTNADCRKMYIKGSRHLETCDYRPIACPICNVLTLPPDLNEHIMGHGKWEDFDLSELSYAINNIVKKGGRVVVTLFHDRSVYPGHVNHTRNLFIWLDEDKICMMCYERNLSTPTVVWMNMHQKTPKMRLENPNVYPIGITVCGNDINGTNIYRLPRSILGETDAFDIKGYRFKFNMRFQIRYPPSCHDNEDNQWKNARVVDVMGNPIRVVFVTEDRYREITINIDEIVNDRRSYIREIPPIRNLEDVDKIVGNDFDDTDDDEEYFS